MFCQFIWTGFQVENAEDIKCPEPERNTVNPNDPSSEAHGASRLQNATPAIPDPPASQITHERNPGPSSRPLELTVVNSKPSHVPEDDVSESSTEYQAKFAAPHSPSEGEVSRLELERQLSVLLPAQTERDQLIARQTDELTRKSALLERADAAAKRAELELREHADRLLMQTSLVKQRDAELVDMQSKLRSTVAKLDESLLSFDQQIGRHGAEFANVRAELQAKTSELEAVRLRLTDAEEGLSKSKVEADKLRAQIAAGSVNRDEDQVIRRLMERMRAIEAEMASMRWNEKSIEEMDCRNEG